MMEDRSPFLAWTQPQPQPFTSLQVTAASKFHRIEHYFHSYGLSQLTKATLFPKLTQSLCKDSIKAILRICIIEKDFQRSLCVRQTVERKIEIPHVAFYERAVPALPGEGADPIKTRTQPTDVLHLFQNVRHVSTSHKSLFHTRKIIIFFPFIFLLLFPSLLTFPHFSAPTKAEQKNQRGKKRESICLLLSASLPFPLLKCRRRKRKMERKRKEC